MGAEEIRGFLCTLWNECNVAASTHNQAMSAILYLYKYILKLKLPWLGTFDRVHRPAQLPVVFTREEAQQVIAAVSPSVRLWCS